MEKIKVLLIVISVGSLITAAFAGISYADVASDKKDIQEDYRQSQDEYDSLNNSYAFRLGILRGLERSVRPADERPAHLFNIQPDSVSVARGRPLRSAYRLARQEHKRL